MQVRLIVLTSLLMFGCNLHKPSSVDIPFNNPESHRSKHPTSIIQIDALYSYNTSYKEASIHKAFAQSKTGAWAWIGNQLKKEKAVNIALNECQLRNKNFEDKYPCRILYLNDELITNSLPE